MHIRSGCGELFFVLANNLCNSQQKNDFDQCIPTTIRRIFAIRGDPISKIVSDSCDHFMVVVYLYGVSKNANLD